MCLNADVVPFVSLGSQDFLYIVCEGIWDCQGDNCCCVPFCCLGSCSLLLPVPSHYMEGCLTVAMVPSVSLVSIPFLLPLLTTEVLTIVVHLILSHYTLGSRTLRPLFLHFLMCSCICSSSSAV